ncbi:MFS transporter [Chloroflexota bacterium]
MAIKNKLFYGYWLVLVGFITTTLNWGVGFYGFSVLNTAIGDEFGWSRSTVMAAFTIFVMAGAVISPLVGRLADRRGPRQVLFLGLITMSLALVLLSKISSVWNYYLLYLLLGVGSVLMGIIPLSMLISNWFYRLRGTMQGLAFAGIGFGGLALSPVVGNYLIPNIGWRNTYLAMALLVLAIMLLLILFVVRNHPHQRGLQPYGKEKAEASSVGTIEINAETGLSFKEALGTPTFWVVGVTSSLYGLSSTAGLQNQVSVLTGQGFTATSAVNAIGVIGLFSAVGKFLFGFLCDRIDPKYSAAIMYGLMTCSLIIMVEARSMTQLWLYAVLQGLAQGGWAPTLAMLTLRYFGTKHYGTVLGTVHLIFFIGTSIGPMIAGFVYDQIGSYRPVLLALAAVNLISIPFISFIRKPRNL